MREQIFILDDDSSTRALGRTLAQSLKDKPCLIFLSGDLGVGKTTLVQGFINELTPQKHNVSSPTYAYLREYPYKFPIYHFDLYRIDDVNQVFELGLDEYFDNQHAFRLIEWPKRLQGLSLSPDINIDVVIVGQKRQATIKYSLSFALLLDTIKFE